MSKPIDVARYPMQIGGTAHDPCGGEWLDSLSPATEETWAMIPRGSAEDAAAAASHEALRGPWAKLTPTQRGALMLRLADLMERGAELLSQMGAYACASRYAGCYVVTLSVDQVTFREPIHVGELVSFLAMVNYVGTSSMEVGIKVVAENIQTQTVRHANSCFFTMVAVDEARKPIKAPVFKPDTAIDIRRFEAALKRRHQRHASASPHIEN